MSPAKLVFRVLARALFCLLVSAVCYFVLTAWLGVTGQASETAIIWALTIVASGAVWVFAFLRPAFELVGSLTRAVRAFLWREENGRYFSFDGRRIRVVVVEGEPWVAETDVFRVLGPKAITHLHWQKMPADEYAEIAEPRLMGFSEKGIEKLFAGKTDDLSRRFRKWLIGEVYFPFRRARERGLPSPWA